jgi:hypothetical protein
VSMEMLGKEQGCQVEGLVGFVERPGERTFNDQLAELIAPALSADQVDAARTAIAVPRRALKHARVGLPTG